MSVLLSSIYTVFLEQAGFQADKTNCKGERIKKTAPSTLLGAVSIHSSFETVASTLCFTTQPAQPQLGSQLSSAQPQLASQLSSAQPQLASQLSSAQPHEASQHFLAARRARSLARQP